MLIAVCAAQCCFLPWAFGGVPVWAQWINLAFSLAASASSWSAQPFARERVARPRPRPRFFLSCYLVAASALGLYILTQLFNPAWKFVSNESSWWLESLPSIKWLPHGVDAPFDRFNGWRWWLVILPLCLTLRSISRGFSRRRSYSILLGAIVINAAFIAVFGVLQKVSHAAKIFGLYPSSNYRFFASFIYPNHAGAFLNLGLGAAAALAVYQLRSKPARWFAVAWAFVAGLIGVAVIFSGSRMSIGLALLSLALFGIASLFRLGPGRDHSRGRSFGPAVAVIILVGLLASVLLTQQETPVRQRFSVLTHHPASALRDRTLARQAGWEMWQAHPVLGWGAGSFRFGFPIYLQKYPAIYQTREGQRNYWEHVHNDWLECFIELGVIGFLPIAFIFFNLGAECIRMKIWQSTLPFFLALAALMTLLHATVDFVFQCPAVLFTWSALVLTALRWRKLEISQTALAGKTPTP